MPLRFRRSVSLFPGARLNFSKSGVSVSLGRPGATFNFGPRGTSATFGLPGTGFSYRVQLSHRNRNRGSGEGSAPSSGNEWPSTPAPEAGSRRIYQPKEGEIASAPVGTLTSASLADLKQLILEARKRRIDLQGQLKIAIRARNAAYRWHWFRSRFPLRFLGAKGAEAAAEKSTERQVALEAVANALSSCFMRLSFQMPPQMAKAWEDLQAAHEALSRVQKIWDVTAEVVVDRYRTRSAASFDINRRPVGLGYAQIEGDVIATTTKALRFGNVTGVMLDFYPGLCLVQGKKDFDLVDLLDVQAQFHEQRFIETESVPPDSQVVDYAWLKSNKDGSRDRRFANNRQIPVALYGALDLSSPTGINEAYLFSSVEVAANFASAFSAAKDAQRAYSSFVPIAADLGAEEDGVADRFAVTVPDPVVMPWWVACGMVCVALIVALLSFSPPGLRAPEQVLPATLPTSSATAGASPGTGSTSMRATAENAVSEKQREEDPGTPTAARSLVTVKTAANIRTAGTPSAGVIRVARQGEKFVEFSRVHGWIQIGPVGADAPIGWVGASLISSD